MSVEDIALTVQVHQKRIKELSQILAWAVYNGAALAGVAMNDPKKYPTLEEAFPDLFEKKEQQDWWKIKERLEQFRQVKRRI